MKIAFTKHAKLRVKQRKIPTKFIESVIVAPDKIHLSFSHRTVARKSFNGKALEIVYRKEGSWFIILTAYWL